MMIVLHEFRGVRYTTPELAKMSGVPVDLVRQRIKKGWTVEQAVCIPSPDQRKRGVVSNFSPLEGTGAGRHAQEIPNISFQEDEAEQ